MDKFTLENELRASGFPLVCGVDEVGRGPLAGPVVCAAVIMPAHEVIDHPREERTRRFLASYAAGNA